MNKIDNYLQALQFKLINNKTASTLYFYGKAILIVCFIFPGITKFLGLYLYS